MSDDLRLLVVTHEFPYPPNHGGRADVWRRLRAMKSLGVRIALVCWFDDSHGNGPSPAELRAVQEVVDVLEAIPKQRGVKQDLLRLTRIARGIPSHAAARVVELNHQNRIMERLLTFKADAVFLDCAYGGVFARTACKTLKLPMFYRSHNIEHKYFEGQAAAAGNMRDRIAHRIACLHIAGFERQMMDASEICFDISADDSAFWRARGVRNSTCLPPLPEAALDRRDASRPVMNEERELAFLGNLNTPNNVRGVQWLVEEVMPIVWSQRPVTVLTVAGSRPNDEVRALISKYPKVHLVEDVADAPQFLEAARVLVNPALTGSGVNVKTLDMLMTNRPIVSTPQGVAGLEPAIKALCLVAGTSGQFASAILTALHAPDIDLNAREKGRVLFSTEAVATAVNAIQRAVRSSGKKPVSVA